DPANGTSNNGKPLVSINEQKPANSPANATPINETRHPPRNNSPRPRPRPAKIRPIPLIFQRRRPASCCFYGP
ncbi:MAG: hypothetical protein KA759_08330, partial [Zoogloea sp.]|nr:hypothetical protein [Zoogloea sp.]